VARPRRRSPATPRRSELDLGTVVPSLGRPARPRTGSPSATPAAGSARPWPTWSPPKTQARTPRPDRTSPRTARTRRRRVVPGSDPPRPRRGTHENHDPAPGRLVRARPDRGQRPAQPAGPGPARGRHPLRPRPRARGDRRHHQLHQHLQPVGDAGRRAAGPQRRRPRAGLQAVGQDLARPRVQGGHGLLRAGRAAAVSREARLPPGRVRLHHLHRQLGPAGARDLLRRSTTTTWSWPRCCRATATSRAASTPTAG
jgi:hypothetical protein